jgi:hypothetical protein
MTPADAPNASDRPLVATKPPQDLAAQPIGNTSRTRRIAPSGTAHPARTRRIAPSGTAHPARTRRIAPSGTAHPARTPLSLLALQSLALRSAGGPGPQPLEPFDPHNWHHRATV